MGTRLTSFSSLGNSWPERRRRKRQRIPHLEPSPRPVLPLPVLSFPYPSLLYLPLLYLTLPIYWIHVIDYLWDDRTLSLSCRVFSLQRRESVTSICLQLLMGFRLSTLYLWETWTTNNLSSWSFSLQRTESITSIRSQLTGYRLLTIYARARQLIIFPPRVYRGENLK